VRSGESVAYLTVGDPALYSTWTYVHKELKSNHKGIEVEIIPGITSMFAFAAESKMSLVEGDETLAVIPACYDLDRIKQVASCCDSLIFLKDGRYFDKVIEMLSQSGFTEDSDIAIAQDVSVEGEVLKINKLRDLKGSPGPVDKYFSIMVAKKKNYGRK
jgi:precorrin-2/cobalt-factor-2 C20-methyltransferase